MEPRKIRTSLDAGARAGSRAPAHLEAPEPLAGVLGALAGALASRAPAPELHYFVVSTEGSQRFRRRLD